MPPEAPDAIQDGVCAAAAVLSLSGVAPFSAGHDAHESLTQYLGWGAHFANPNDAWLSNGHCDPSYSIATAWPLVTTGCVFTCATLPGGSLSCTSPVTAASLVAASQVHFNLDCYIHLVAPPTPGTLKSKVTNFNGGTEPECSHSFPAGGGGTGYVAQHLHQSRNHGIQPGNPLPVRVVDEQANRLEFVNCCVATLTLRHTWFFTSAPVSKTAHLDDPDDDTGFHSNDPDVHTWNMSDPGGDDRLIKEGVDITPAIGGTAILEAGVTLLRQDAGGRDVMWRLASSLPNKSLVVSKERDHEGGRDWSIYPVVT